VNVITSTANSYHSYLVTLQPQWCMTCSITEAKPTVSQYVL